MDIRFSRTAKLIGLQGLDKLNRSHIAVFGLGGVGSYSVEALVRAGVGTLSIFDYDTIDITNINRQIPATSSTVGRLKAEVVAERAKDINPSITIHVHSVKIDATNVDKTVHNDYDYIIDAIDMVSSKLLLIEKAHALNIPLISCMGTGNKLNPSAFEIVDIYKTHTCPLAKVMRTELKKRCIPKQAVLFSSEPPKKPQLFDWETPVEGRRETPSSISFIPSIAGLMLAGFAINTLIDSAL